MVGNRRPRGFDPDRVVSAVRRLPERTDVVYYRLDPAATPAERWAGARQSAKLCLISEGRDLKPFDFGLYITREV